MNNIEIVFLKDKNTDDNIKEFLRSIEKTGAKVGYIKDAKGDECHVFEIKSFEKRSPGKPKYR